MRKVEGEENEENMTRRGWKGKEMLGEKESRVGCEIGTRRWEQ